MASASLRRPRNGEFYVDCRPTTAVLFFEVAGVVTINQGIPSAPMYVCY